MNLLIDTNIFLSFYHLSSDDLEELKKLTLLVRNKKVTLFLPEHISIEFHRNRASKIADALKRLRSQQLSLQFPQLCRDYDEYKILRQLQQDFNFNHSRLISNIEEDVSKHGLKADATIQELFRFAERIGTSPSILEQARIRVDIGNPPGKKGSIGDAIVWEGLLEKVPEEGDLCFVTADKDYYSPLDIDLFNPFLLEEWEEIKRSRLFYYKRLSHVLKDEFPEIKLSDEIEKDQLIRNLVNSSTFAETHTVIWKLSKYSDFSPTQIDEIIVAALLNNQVHWIIEDTDVYEFLNSVISGQERLIDQGNLQALQELLPKVSKNKNEELPPFLLASD